MSTRKIKRQLDRKNLSLATDKGFALFTTMIIVIVIGIISLSSMRIADMNEVLAGNSIQRSRAFQAAEGGLIDGEKNAALMSKDRVFSSSVASDGLFEKDSIENHWWRNEDYPGALTPDDAEYPGVAAPPEYVVEEIGNYVSDGGSGIVSLDRGGAGYGRLTSSDREVVLYRLQSNGVGSSDSAQAVVESLYVQSQ